MAKKNLTPEEKAEKKSNRKAVLVFIGIVAVIAPLVWFAMDYFAEESVIDYRTIEINGDTLHVILSEKSSSPGRQYNNADHHSSRDGTEGDTHYGYFLELYDSTKNKSLDKIKFKSPVWKIQSTPELFVYPDGRIWLVSTSQDHFEDKPGFILKFEIKNNKIQQLDFALDEKYRIRNLKDDWVIITDGNTFDGDFYDPISGCTYFDLETEEIVVLEPWF